MRLAGELLLDREREVVRDDLLAVQPGLRTARNWPGFQGLLQVAE